MKRNTNDSTWFYIQQFGKKKMRVTKIFTTETAHRLLGYKGACSNIHGHTYRFEVTFQGEQLDELGMVIDFKEIKNNIGGLISDFFDHCIVLNEKDPLIDILHNCLTTNVSVMTGNPTAENMALLLKKSIVSLLKTGPNNVTLYKVVVWETPTSFAEALA